MSRERIRTLSPGLYSSLANYSTHSASS